MTTGDQQGDRGEHVRAELGAYVLGALEPAARRAVERHVDRCPDCRDELARLSALPPLLDRLSAAEATADLGGAARRTARGLTVSAASDRRRLHGQLVRWRAATAVATAAAVAAALLAWQPWQPAPDRLVVAVVPVTADADAVAGTVAAIAWEWGTTVEIRVADLPSRPAYVVWALDHDGRRERAGTWGPTAHGGALVRGATAIPRDRLAGVEVTDPAGEALFTATFAEPSRSAAPPRRGGG